jgi:hypothetical protein
MHHLIARTSLLIAIALLAASTQAQTQAQTLDQPNFAIQVHPGSYESLQFTVTNLSPKILAAAAFQFKIPGDSQPQGQMVWDSLLHEVVAPVPDPQLPLAPNASMSLNLPHVMERPIPDQIEILAGIWSDGETFGDKLWIDRILGMRASTLSSYQLGISILQEALDKDWTEDQIVDALKGQPSGVAIYTLRGNFPLNNTNTTLKETSGMLKSRIRFMLSDFTRKADLLRAAKST